MPTGIPQNTTPGNTGSAADLTCNQTQLITLAHKVIGVVEESGMIDAEQLADGKLLLGLIIRETDGSGKWRWTIPGASHLTLVGGVYRYDVDNGLPANISDLLTVFYRDANAYDLELKIWKAETYEGITNKLAVETPQGVYLTENRDLGARVLYLCPMTAGVTAGSVVTGQDGAFYKCIAPHLSSSANRPVTGANAEMVWAVTLDASAGDWVSGQNYVNSEQLRLLFRRPIFDFDAPSDVPDFPLPWPRVILYKLAFDLGDIYSIPIPERQHMIQKSKGAFDDIFPTTKAKSSKPHHKVKFY